MLEHRFRDYFESQDAAPEALSCAFVACPVTAFGPAAEQIERIYALAAERTRQQLQPRRYVPEFSLN